MLIRAAILSFVCLTQELTQGFSVAPSRRSAVSSTSLYHSYDYSKWDDLEDDDEDITFENLRVRPLAVLCECAVWYIIELMN